MPKKFNYRKYYAEYYGIDIPEEFDIHHIDGNRNNNSIDNLIMLPSKLHRKYHMTRKFAENFDTTISLQDSRECETLMAKHFYEAFLEINHWVNVKNDMDMTKKARKSI